MLALVMTSCILFGSLIFKQFAASNRVYSLALPLAKVLKADLDGLAIAASIVARGGLVCYPTDTVYGLGCDPLNASAVEKLLKAKGGRTKAMPVLVRNLEYAQKIAQVTERAKRLAAKYWPGPLTIVLPAKDVLPGNLALDGTIGLRSPNLAICLDLLELCSGFLVGTSANLTGKPPATSADQVVKTLGDRVDAIIDGGKSILGVSSTVVDLTKTRLTVVREGPIGRSEILRCLREHNSR